MLTTSVPYVPSDRAIRCLITADLHIHKHQNRDTLLANGRSGRLQDGLDVMAWIGDVAKVNFCQHIIVAGDLFHTRQKVGSDILSLVSCEVQKWVDNGITVHLIAGNHDQYDYMHTALDALSIGFLDTRRVFVYKIPSVILTTGTQHDCIIVAVPYRETRPEYQAAWDLCRNLHQVGQTCIVVGHLGLVGAKLNKSEHVPKFGVPIEDIPDSVAKAFFGHYHPRQAMSERIQYVGNPYALDQNDGRDSKGVTILTIPFEPRYYQDTKIEIDRDLGQITTSYIENTFSPKFITVDLTVPDFDATFRKECTGNFVTLLVDKYTLRKVVEHQWHLYEDQARHVQLQYKPVTVSSSHITAQVLQMKNILNNDDRVSWYTKQKNQLEDCLQKGLEYLQSAKLSSSAKES